LGIDLTRLESRPTRKELGEYRFFISFKISKNSEGKIKEALKILKKNAKVDVLGKTFNLK
jgi:prephenate dehydratase